MQSIEVQNGVPVQYYTLGVRQGASVSWLYGDHLGSTSASSGAAATSERYYAYGKDRGTGNLPTDHRFTGQISDGSGLVFMNARYYDPVLGSFISPDTVVPEPGQPEGYNRYAYANGNPLRFIDPTGHYSIEELQAHFGVDSYEALMALFNEGGLYAGNTGWYDILRDAQDGDSITAFLSDGNGTSIQGAFGRTPQGRITVDMGHNQIVDESVFATFGGRRSGMSAQYGWTSDYGMYHLEGAGGGGRWATAMSGTQAIADRPCNTWDCVALGYDAAAIGGNTLASASLAGAIPSGCLSLAGVAAGTIMNRTATAAGLVHTYQGLSSGASSNVDAVISSMTATLNPFPFVGSVSGGVQILYDIFDPFIPWG
jgi:RHS repeat-associated protein